MFKGLLTPAWQSESVEKRLHAVQKLDPQNDANQQIFVGLIETDSEMIIRHAALDKLSNPYAIWQINQSHADQVTRQHALTALAQVIGPKSNITEISVRQLLDKHPALNSTMAALCPFENIRHELAATLSQVAQAGLLGSIEYSQTRQHVAQQLTDIDALELARKQLKGKDKSAEKIVKAKLDLHHATIRQEQENQLAAEAICEKMELLALHDWDTEFKAKFNIWSERWQSLTFTPKPQITKRYLVASRTVSEHVEQVSLIEATCHAQQTLTTNLHQYCLKIAPLSWQDLVEQTPATYEIVTAANTEWLTLNEISIAPPALLKRFLSLQTALESLSVLGNFDDTHLEELQQTTINHLGSAIKHINWPAALPPLQAKSEAAATHLELKQTLANDKKDTADKLDKIHKRINRLLGSTKRGNLVQAKRELAAISKASENYKGKEKSALIERLSAAAAAVDKMDDWKNFATEPKYLELCDAMEALHSPTEKSHPDALAVKIAKLQKQWKALGHSDSADQHWARFKTAADKAYEPCALFFEQRHATRAQNLEKREPLVQKMQSLLEKTDWDNAPDYKNIETELQKNAREWQKIKDVERNAGQRQWERLSSFKSKIYAKLDLVYEANLALKHQLIEQAQALLAIEPKEDTINKLQLFQARWKQVGITKRNHDQTAWKKFKAATDAVYEKLQGVRKAKRAEEDTQLAGYRQIINNLKTLAKTATNLAQGDATFEQLQADYKALPPLPKGLPEKLIEGLDKDFQRACDTYSSARTRITQLVQDQVLQALSEKAALCYELEKASSDDEIARLNEAIADIELADKDLNKRFAERLAAARQDDRTEATHARESLCLNLEILLDVESPAEAKAQRMKVQLERLKTRGIGQQAQNKETYLKALKLDWLCLPGAEPEQQILLDKRFQIALTKK